MAVPRIWTKPFRLYRRNKNGVKQFIILRVDYKTKQLLKERGYTDPVSSVNTIMSVTIDHDKDIDKLFKKTKKKLMDNGFILQT